MTRMRSLVRVQYRPLPAFSTGSHPAPTPTKSAGISGSCDLASSPVGSLGRACAPDLLPPRPCPPPGRSGHRGVAGSAGQRPADYALANPLPHEPGTAPPNRSRTTLADDGGVPVVFEPLIVRQC